MKWSFGGLTISVRLLVTLVVVGILAVTLVPLGLQWIKQEQSYRSIVTEVAVAEQKANSLRQDLAAWDDEDFIAATARERLGYVRPGETQYVVTDAPEREEQAAEVEHNNLTGPPKPWMWQLAESLRDADLPPASSGLSSELAAETQVEPIQDGQG